MLPVDLANLSRYASERGFRLNPTCDLSDLLLVADIRKHGGKRRVIIAGGWRVDDVKYKFGKISFRFLIAPKFGIRRSIWKEVDQRYSEIYWIVKIFVETLGSLHKRQRILRLLI